MAVPGDVRKSASCEAAVKQVVDQFGRLDILVNGAAGNFLASAAKLSENGFKTVIEIDTLGTFNMSKAAFNQYMKKNGGSIINISALLHWNGSAFQVHSSAAKAGVDALTKVLAVEWGPYNVRVNGIVPGAIKGTEGFARLGDLGNLNNKAKTNSAASKSPQPDDLSALPLPLQRLGEVQDIANTALYLSSSAADYITGWNVVVDGGSFLTAPNMVFSSPKFISLWSQAKL